MIKIEDLVFAYEQESDTPSAAKLAVDGVSFDVEKGPLPPFSAATGPVNPHWQ